MRRSKEQISKIMSAIRSENTKPEIMLRKALWARGLRFRVHYGKEKIDVAFPSKKLAVFIDGCFWHLCPEHSNIPRTHRSYWLPKLKRNTERDKAKNERLKASGWMVMRFWEHDLPDMENVLSEIELALRKERARILLSR